MCIYIYILHKKAPHPLASKSTVAVIQGNDANIFEKKHAMITFHGLDKLFVGKVFFPRFAPGLGMFDS